ncbi:MAG: hypothetical protein U0169_27650 [Polyangiaceae bacterium]
MAIASLPGVGASCSPASSSVESDAGASADGVTVLYCSEGEDTCGDGECSVPDENGNVTCTPQPRDAGSDAELDAGGSDALTDASMDAARDASIDAGSDAATDAGSDAATDAGSDAATDAGSDAATDAGSDAATDASPPADAGVTSDVGFADCRYPSPMDTNIYGAPITCDAALQMAEGAGLPECGTGYAGFATEDSTSPWPPGFHVNYPLNLSLMYPIRMDVCQRHTTETPSRSFCCYGGSGPRDPQAYLTPPSARAPEVRTASVSIQGETALAKCIGATEEIAVLVDDAAITLRAIIKPDLVTDLPPGPGGCGTCQGAGAAILEQKIPISRGDAVFKDGVWQLTDAAKQKYAGTLVDKAKSSLAEARKIARAYVAKIYAAKGLSVVVNMTPRNFLVTVGRLSKAFGPTSLPEIGVLIGKYGIPAVLGPIIMGAIGNTNDAHAQALDTLLACPGPLTRDELQMSCSECVAAKIPGDRVLNDLEQVCLDPTRSTLCKAYMVCLNRRITTCASRRDGGRLCGGNGYRPPTDDDALTQSFGKVKELKQQACVP